MLDNQMMGETFEESLKGKVCPMLRKIYLYQWEYPIFCSMIQMMNLILETAN